MQVICDMMHSTFARLGIWPYTDALEDAMQVACDMRHNALDGSNALTCTRLCLWSAQCCVQAWTQKLCCRSAWTASLGQLCLMSRQVMQSSKLWRMLSLVEASFKNTSQVCVCLLFTCHTQTSMTSCHGPLLNHSHAKELLFCQHSQGRS